MKAGNRSADLRGNRGKVGKRLTEEYICSGAQPMDTDNSASEGLGWGRATVEEGKEGEIGDICNTINDKNKFKK